MASLNSQKTNKLCQQEQKVEVPLLAKHQQQLSKKEF
jgi:hypothetical protein